MFRLGVILHRRASSRPGPRTSLRAQGRREPGTARAGNGETAAASPGARGSAKTADGSLPATWYGAEVAPLGEYDSAQGRGPATIQTSERSRATAAALSVAAGLVLAVDDTIVLHDSNKLTLRLLPCDVLARVAPVEHQVAQFEIELARLLAESGCPVAALEARVEPRVYERDGFAVTLWTSTNPWGPRSPRQPTTPVRSSGYTPACASSMSPRRTSRTGSSRLSSSLPAAIALRRLATRTGSSSATRCENCGEQSATATPLSSYCTASRTLETCSRTKNGLLFIDLETCCRGPVEFDLAHAPAEVTAHYPNVDQDLLRDCRTLVLAMITTWRWDRDDQLPNGRQLGTEWLSQIRAAVGRR